MVITERRLPEHEFLKTVLRCIDKRCAILGLDAATKIHHGGQTGSAMNEADKRALIIGIAAKLGAMEDDRDHENDTGAEDGRGMVDAEPGADLGLGGPERDAGG